MDRRTDDLHDGLFFICKYAKIHLKKHLLKYKCLEAERCREADRVFSVLNGSTYICGQGDDAIEKLHKGFINFSGITSEASGTI